MTDKLRLTLAQLNATLGDLRGNAARAKHAWQLGKAAHSDFVILPEMFLLGYQPQDLVRKPAFASDAMRALLALAQECADGPALGIGTVIHEGEQVFNAYGILEAGRIRHMIKKHHLPNYEVFDEQRLFDSATISGPYGIHGVPIGTPICEDAWFDDVCETLGQNGAQILVVPNASPYERGKYERRMNAMVARVGQSALPMVYVNLLGGQDDQVFDGGSFVLNRAGALAAKLPLFEEAIEHITFQRGNAGWVAQNGAMVTAPEDLEQDYHAMVLALRDYLHKTGFEKVLLGLSGGVDSALVASIAADAIGAENLRCVMLPSRYTAQSSLAHAQAVAENLGCRYEHIAINLAQDSINDTLAPLFADRPADLTEENIQSRLRGLLLMALSNKFGEMLLSTGNKSEIAVGYATIYGDMAGGYNPIKDLYKTRVFAICRWRNQNHRHWMKGKPVAPVPESIITKAPSAELRPNQKDSDSLPPYDVLDGILALLVDQDASLADCIAAGYDREVVRQVENLLYGSEYKRFQSAPGTRLSARAFWLDRRYPITNRWRDGDDGQG